jgi:DNA polymerase-3 subunit alpha (Gram-positive type)
MAVCLKCGIAGETCLCNKCRQDADLEALCNDIINFEPGRGENQLWDKIAAEMICQSNFKNLVFSVSADLPTPRKEYMRLLCIAAGSANVPRTSRAWLYEIYDVFKENEGLSVDEKNSVRGLMLGALYMDYRYEEADALAGKLLEQLSLPKQAFYSLADFFSRTRRYDEASEAIETARGLYADDSSAILELNKLAERNENYRDAETNGKKEYMPNPKENKDIVRKAYVDFLASIGIDAELPPPTMGGYIDKDGRRSKYPIPIPKDKYPVSREIREANFDSFVAFDFETTGLNTTIDSIIEIGAVKVVNGNIVDSEEFTFQELVKPFKKSLNQKITDITGITKEEVANAREMWEVTPDFIRFVGNDILVGFNNVRFDSKFLVRAGRYSNLIIENPHFDVMRYAEQFKEKLDIDGKGVSLKNLSEKLGIENPRAHRALADAMTTAAIYLKLKEMDGGVSEVSVDDLLSDLDEW